MRLECRILFTDILVFLSVFMSYLCHNLSDMPAVVLSNKTVRRNFKKSCICRDRSFELTYLLPCEKYVFDHSSMEFDTIMLLPTQKECLIVATGRHSVKKKTQKLAQNRKIAVPNLTPWLILPVFPLPGVRRPSNSYRIGVGGLGCRSEKTGRIS